jgi:hypothetical protein
MEEVLELKNKNKKEDGNGDGIWNEGGSKKREPEKVEIENKAEEISKITITKVAELKLLELLQRVNDGFDCGRVNRQSLTSWIVNHTCEDADNSLIEEIRNAHFDEFMMLEAILRKGKAEGKLPSEFINLLKNKSNFSTIQKIKGRKNLTDKYINDVSLTEDQKDEPNGTKGIQTN